MSNNPTNYVPRDKYLVECEGNAITSVTNAFTNQKIALGESTPEFCKFLTWYAGNNKTDPASVRFPSAEHELSTIIRDSEFICTLSEYIHEIKRRKLILYTHGTQTISLQQCDSKHFTTVNSREPGKTAVVSFDDLCMTCPSQSGGNNPNNNEIAPTTQHLYVTREVYLKMEEMLKDESSDVRRLSSWPVTRTFVYVDISEFSQFKSAHQAIIINYLIGLATHLQYWGHLSENEAVRADLDEAICIGDGYIFVFKSASFGVYFAAALACLIEHIPSILGDIEFHFRIGIHTGLVRSFWDEVVMGKGRWNYVGDGINVGSRVISAIGQNIDDVVYMSYETRRAIIASQKTTTWRVGQYIQNKGRHRDKHGIKRRLYELNHMGWLGEQINMLQKNLTVNARL